MTIAAGFVCSDGLVLCADTEVTDLSGGTKESQPKLWAESSESFAIALAGAGDAVLLRAFRDRLFDWLRNPLARLAWAIPNLATGTWGKSAADAIEPILRKFYEDEIYHRPDYREQYWLQVLIGLRTAQGCALFDNSGPSLARVDDSRCIGAGTPLGSYLAQTLFEPGSSTKVARLVATYLLDQTKRHTPGCGGDSHIVTIPVEGQPFFGEANEIANTEQVFDQVYDALRPILFICSDVSVPEDLLKERLDHLVRVVKNVRVFARMQHHLEQAREK